MIFILDLPLAVADFEFRNGNITEAKDLIFKAKDSKFVLKDTSRPSTKAKDNNTGGRYRPDACMQ